MRARVALALCSAIALDTGAVVPEEIQVYTDDVNEPGEFGLETHISYVPQGLKTPDFPGQLPSHRVLQVTPEFSLGLAKNWDGGLYLLSTLGPSGNADFNGAKLRIKYIAPRADGERLFWGLNSELGYTSPRVSETYWNMELRPIIGYRSDTWLVSFNPVIGAALSGPVSREPAFTPMLKVARAIGDGYMVGFEHYAETGPIHHRDPLDSQNHVLYAAIDVAKSAFDINFGIGHGLTSASEKWVLKAIIGIPLK